MLRPITATANAIESLNRPTLVVLAPNGNQITIAANSAQPINW